MTIRLGDLNLEEGGPLFIISGPCVLEDETLPLQIGQRMAEVCGELGLPYIFKASYDKANRTSSKGFRGPGLERGLDQLARIRKELGVPVLTDVHSPEEATAAGEVVDVLQIPAFLCRQTDLLYAASKTGKCVNVKKGQFLSPQEMKNVVDKLDEFSAASWMLTERGTTFGYNNLVTDMRSIPIMQKLGAGPVVIDATHSVQQPGGMGDRSGGAGEFAPTIARAAIAAGADGLFAETHPEPAKAKSDGPNMIPLAMMPALLRLLKQIHEVVRGKAPSADATKA
ncbi:MAG: 3-deoxy-8-phosphooctulonate synthase [Planctomycetes bacterium]|nr:3-deoxy-8-phosphooctulonate synthase [Planctomycetota bacterium]